jgi:hypothetical protein
VRHRPSLFSVVFPLTLFSSSTAAMPEATSLPTPTSPRLPYDVLRLVAERSVEPSYPYDEGWKEMAGTFSLLCRDFRDFGQGRLWEMVTLPHQWVEKWSSSLEQQRLLKMVRTLVWDTNESWPYSRLRRWPARPESAQAFLCLLATLDGLTGVETVEFGSGDWTTLFSAISTSPSSRQITSISLEQSKYRDHSAYIAEKQLLPFLASLPALSSFTFNPSGIAPPSSSLATYTPSLPLRSINFDSRGCDYPADILAPCIPRYALSLAINPTTLRSVELSISYSEYSGWLQWLSNPSFPSLHTFKFFLYPSCGSETLNLLISLLSHHPQLVRLYLREVRDYGRLDRDQKRSPEILRFLQSLPPSLEVLLLHFRFLTMGAIRTLIRHGQPKSLRQIQYWSGSGEKAMRMEWNEQEQRFDEVRSPFLSFLCPSSLPQS